MSHLQHLTEAIADRYAIVREIGVGGMATVYLARDLKHDRDVAIKVLKPELGAVLGVERFLAEIKVTANLQHPNLLPLFDSGEANGLLFYVMPYVDGESLRARLEREHQLPIDEAIRIAVAVADALSYAHDRGVIHRDLKPENILLQHGQPIVADFGIALAVSKAGGQRVTQTGLSLGTPQYMSPEQATGDRVIDARADIYSLGAITYEMLVGDPPHSGHNAQTIIAKLMTEEVRSLTVLRRSVPLAVDAAVRHALEKLAADRFSSAAQFAEALQRKGDVADPGRYSQAGSSPGATKSIRRLRLVASVAIALAIVAAAGWGVAARRHAESPATVRFVLNFATGFRLGNAVQGQGTELAISPDGATVAIVGSGAGLPQMILIRTLGDLQARPLPGTEVGYSPFFSPDGKWLAFFASQQLKKVAVAGGPVIPVSEVLTGLVYGATWAANDQIVFGIGSGLAAVSASGGPVRMISSIDTVGGWIPRWPHALADGKTIVMTAWTTSLPSSRIAVMSMDGGKPRLMDLAGTSPLGVLDGQLVYASATGSLMAVPFDARAGRATGAPTRVVDQVVVASGVGIAHAALSESGTLAYRSGVTAAQVLLADMGGGTRVLVGEPRAYAYARLSPDGRRLAMAIGSGASTDIWIHDLASHVTTRLTTEGANNDRPEWTPDGARVLFRSERGSGSYSLWSQAADFSGPAELLLKTSRDIWEGVMTPDGSAIVYRTGTMGAADILSRPLRGDTTPKPVAATNATEWAARVSPNGQWVAYASNESGATQVYIHPFPGPGGGRTQVSVDGGDTPVWARDGHRLFYVNGQKMMVATVATTPALAIGSREELFEGDFTYLPGHATYDVSVDGKQLLLLKPVGGTAEAVVAYNWRTELRARTGAKTQK